MKNITGYIEAAGICKANVVEITKQDAALLLKSNTANRKINKGNVEYLRQSMNDGRWMFNGDTIVLDAQGRLKSGQHRLTAFVGSKMDSITVLLVHLLCDEDVLLSLNRGLRLNSSQYLAVKGYKNAKELAGIGRTLLSIELKIGNRSQLAKVLCERKQDYEVENIIKRIPAALMDQVNSGHSTPFRIGSSVMGALIFAAMRYPEVTGDICNAWSMAREGDTPKQSLAWGIMRVNRLNGAGSDKVAEKINKALSVIRSYATTRIVPDKIYALDATDFISQMDMAKSMRRGIFATLNQEG